MPGPSQWSGTSPRGQNAEPVSPVEHEHQLGRQRAKNAEIQERKELAIVTQRTEHRLGVAEQRHERKIEGIESERNQHARSLDAEATWNEATGRREEAYAQGHVARTQELTQGQEAREAQHREEQAQAIQNVARSRELIGEHCDRTHAEILKTGEVTDRTVAAARSDARAKLDTLEQHRLALQARAQEEERARHGQCGDRVSRLDSQAHADTVSSEVTRHRADMRTDLEHSKAQASKTISQEKVGKNIAQREKDAAGLAMDKHQAQVRCDHIVAERLAGSNRELNAAHDYCSDVLRTMADESARYKRRMQQIDADANANAQDVASSIHAKEEERLAAFASGQRAIEETEEGYRNHRDRCEEELADVNKRLREIEQDCRTRANRILADWVAGSEAAEMAVRQFEKQGLDCIANMQAAVAREIGSCAEKSRAVQQDGANTVMALEQEAKRVVDSTQPTLEDARRADEEAAAAAVSHHQRIRGDPEVIRAAADREIDALFAAAADEEAQIEREARERIAAAKRAMYMAHEEEQALHRSSAAGMSRMRGACYQLRLANLHDIAQAMTSGEHDLRLPPGNPPTGPPGGVLEPNVWRAH